MRDVYQANCEGYGDPFTPGKNRLSRLNAPYRASAGAESLWRYLRGLAWSTSYSTASGEGYSPRQSFFPLTYLAMRSQFRFRGGLGKAWRPFGYSLVLLTVAKFVEIGTKAPQDVETTTALLWFLVPILICAVVLYFTYRDKNAAPSPT